MRGEWSRVLQSRLTCHASRVQVFLEADNTRFSPSCIKSHFLHTFIVVRCSPKIKFNPARYEISVVTRDEVGAYKPYLWEQSLFTKVNIM